MVERGGELYCNSDSHQPYNKTTECLEPLVLPGCPSQKCPFDTFIEWVLLAFSEQHMSYELFILHLSLFPVWFQLCLLRIGSLNVDWAPLLQLLIGEERTWMLRSMLVHVLCSVTFPYQLQHHTSTDYYTSTAWQFPRIHRCLFYTMAVVKFESPVCHSLLTIDTMRQCSRQNFEIGGWSPKHYSLQASLLCNRFLCTCMCITVW